MYILITILIVIAAVLLILAVLIQNPKGGGLAANFSSSNQIMGVARTNEFIEKVTWGLAIAILVLALLSNMAKPGDAIKSGNSVIQENIDNAPMPQAPGQQVPGQTPPVEGNPGGATPPDPANAVPPAGGGPPQE